MSKKPVNRTNFLKILTSLAGVLGVGSLMGPPAFSQSNTNPGGSSTAPGATVTPGGEVCILPQRTINPDGSVTTQGMSANPTGTGNTAAGTGNPTGTGNTAAGTGNPTGTGNMQGRTIVCGIPMTSDGTATSGGQ